MPGLEEYTVGWICAITTEFVAAQRFLDEEHGGPDSLPPNDNNDYTLGRIGRHNVVIAVLPDGEYGTSSAAIVARDMLHSFPSIRIGLMVGIGGGAPSANHDIRLGDIVVSAPRDGKGGVFQYDFGKTIQDQSFRPTGFLNQSPVILRTAVNGLKAKYETDGHQIEDVISNVFEEKPRLRKKYKRPDSTSDRLYRSVVVHPSDTESSCMTMCGDESSNLVSRPERTEDEDNPAIHYGLIASANQLMKDALIRDKLTAEMGVLCFEMEAAGLMNHFPCLVVRGICDYSDSHKNKEWQGYAAMAAAAYTKDLLNRIPPGKVEAEKKIGEILSAVTKIEEQVDKVGSELVRHKDGRKRQDVLGWLSQVDFASQHSDVFNRRQPGTGQWLLESDEFKEWLKTDKQTLFCPGIPGAGKTIITAIVINYLMLKFDQSTGIAYIYCNFQRQADQEAEKLLAGLLKQLARRRLSLPASVENLYDRHQKNGGTRPTFDELSETLRSVAAMYSKVLVVVDALDECQISDNNRTRFLAELFKLQNNAVTNIFATSRPSGEISDYFSNGLSRTISATPDDILTYLNNRISLQKSDTNTMDDEMLNMIREGVLEATDGMFLLARLHTDTLLSQLTKGDLKEALQELGRGMAGLDSTYDQAMGRIEDQGHHREVLAKRILAWIVYSKRPLSTSELQHALATRKGATALDTDFIPAAEVMLSLCAGLVSIDKESSIIRLVHYTTQEYFERRQNQYFPEAESEIAITSITYLSFDAFGSGFCRTDAEFEQRLRSNPLYDYAARNWGHHARAVLANQVAVGPKAAKAQFDGFHMLVITFLKSTEKVEASSQAMLVKGVSYHSQRVPRNMTGVHLAAYYGLVKAIKDLLDNEHGVDSTDSTDRTPISWAAENGGEAAVKSLLNEGAQLDLKDKAGQTPLSLAIENGNVAVARLLLEKGAMVDYHYKTLDWRDRTPLSRAAEKGYDEIVELLLKHNAQPNMEDKSSQSPLSLAIENGNVTVARLLLEKGAIVDYHYKTLPDRDPFDDDDDDDDRTPLSRATEKGYNEIVELLLKHNAQPDIEDKSGQSPLSLAIENGNVTVVRLLLEKGAIVDYHYKTDRTPLSRAAEKGHDEIVKLLLPRLRLKRRWQLDD